MGLFPQKKQVSTQGSILQSVPRNAARFQTDSANDPMEQALYAGLRRAVPIIDSAIGKIVRLTGSFQLISSDPKMQKRLDWFAENVHVGLTGCFLSHFVDGYLDSMLTFGNALGEMLIDPKNGILAGLQLAPPERIRIRQEKIPSKREYWLRSSDSDTKDTKILHPERILFSALAPPPGGIYGVSVLRGLPALSEILLRIYECIGQNYDRMGNVRYTVTYKPSGDPAERAYAGDRAKRIAKEWQDGMRAGGRGEIRDFVCADDVDIRVIGADNALLDTEVPVRQLLEQLIAKLSIPPFLLGLNWSSTERMSSQQADILTSELEYYRRVLEPTLRQIGNAFLRLEGSDGFVQVDWSNINLQDETELAQTRLWNAQAAQLEK